MIILDTNVLSELMRPSPSPAVVRWTGAQAAAGLYTTSITQAEILHGILLLPAGRKRAAIEAAAESMFTEDFRDRILPLHSTRKSLPSRARPGFRLRRGTSTTTPVVASP